MALKKTVIVKGTATVNLNGIQFAEEYTKPLIDCYIKVESVSGNKTRVVCSVSQTSADKITQTNSYAFVPDMEGANFIKQSYEYLKTLPEFADAQDC